MFKIVVDKIIVLVFKVKDSFYVLKLIYIENNMIDYKIIINWGK